MKIKKYQDGDMNAILELFEIVFKKPLSKEYWKWRFLDNPDSKFPMIYLMWDEAKLVGHYAVSPNRMIINNKEIKSALSMTTMTHPEYGGRGIFSKLATELYENESSANNLELVWGFPNSNSHRGFIKNLQWKDAQIIPMMSLVNPSIKKTEESNFKKADSFNSNNIKKYQDTVTDFNVYSVKSIESLTWRYNKNPTSDYSTFSTDEGYYFVCKFYFDGKINQLDVVDWIVSDNQKDIQDSINTMLDFYSNSKISQINIWTPLVMKHRLHLEKMGFTMSTPLTYLGYRSFNNDKVELSNNWFFQMCDSDVY